ncbi:MAG: biotin-dependent carboxyltransferase family protein, partial [Pyrinomonadaceae bacterium]
MSLVIKKEGILTTVQDLGRTGFRRLGVNPGGVMDRTAARLVNVLLGNDENSALLEMHFPAGDIIFDHKTIFALGGADLDARLAGLPIENWKVHVAEANVPLRFSGKVSGERAYLAVLGGFFVKEWLGSKSTNLVAAFGGFDGRRLKTGDRIDAPEMPDRSPAAEHSFISRSLIPRYSRFPTVRVIPGAEFDFLTVQSQETFRNEDFVVSMNSNRMGYRLAGKSLKQIDAIEIVSTAVGFGTIQLLPDGQLIVLMADHQTSGGYPRIAHVIEPDLPLLAQIGP